MPSLILLHLRKAALLLDERTVRARHTRISAEREHDEERGLGVVARPVRRLELDPEARGDVSESP